MNSDSELYERMLESFPVNLLKSYFKYDGVKEEVIEFIVQNFNLVDIDKFVCSNFGFLHQRLFLREVNKNSLIGQPNLMNGKLMSKISDTSGASWFYLHKALFQYFDTKSDTKEIIEFFVPIKIHHKGKKLIISYNTFARDIRSYFDYPVFPMASGNLEDFIFQDIRSNCSQTIFKLDLNKGVKYLWENDIVDGLDVKHRQSYSIRQDRMDESSMYKISYPDDWNELMKTPIQKTKFKMIGNNALKHFDCNPSTGFIGVSVHPDNSTEVDDLLDLILNHN